MRANTEDRYVQPVVEMKKISKAFGGVIALRDVDFRLFEGEVVGLVGDNGAGKSTLIKILSGVYIPDKGDIYIGGERVEFRSPLDAWKYGIATVYQELALADKMNVVENIFLGHELVKNVLGLRILDKRRMRQRAGELLKQLLIELKSLDVPVSKLSGGQRQGIAICRALNLEARVICMDEPTASMAVGESERILDFVRRLREQGKAVIFISHNLEHVFRVVDRLVVLRHGRVVGEGYVEDLDKDTVVKLITGVLENLNLLGEEVREGTTGDLLDRNGSKKVRR